MEWIELGELAEIQTGKLNANAASENGKYPFFTCAKEISYIDEYEYDKECILVAGNGDLNVKYYNGKFDAYQRTYIIESINKEKLNTMFLFYFMSTYIKKLRELSIGGVIKYIKLGNLTDAKIPVPPINIQKQIVEILDQAQALIDNRKEQIKLLDDLIESIFYDMFGDPVRNDKGWEVDVLKNKIYDIDSGWSPRCYTNQAGIDKWGVLKLSAVTGGIYNSFENKELPEELNPKQENEVKTGDLLITRKNTPELVGDSCYVFETRNRLMLPDTIFRINTKKEINKLFLLYIFNNRTFKYKIKNLASGSAKSMSNISKQKLNNLKVPIPPIELQNEFSEKVEQIESKKQLLEDSLFLLENNYNSLMQKAFKGELF